MNKALLTRHRERAGVLIQGLGLTDDAELDPLRAAIRTLSEEQALSLYLLLVEHASTYRGWNWGGARLFVLLHVRPLPWTADDVRLLFDLAQSARDWTVLTTVKAAPAAAERVAAAELSVEQLTAALRKVETEVFDASERVRLMVRLRLLIEAAYPSTGATVRTGVIRIKDGWSHAALERPLAVTEDVRVVSDLLEHAAKIPSGPRPSKAWLTRTGELLAGRPGVAGLVRDLLELVYACEPVEYKGGLFTFSVRVDQANADLVRGLLWTAQVSGETWLTPLALAVCAAGSETKVLNGCYAVLGRRGDAASIAALVQLQRATRDRGQLTQIAHALDEAAATAGISRSELTEQTVPDAGLDATRERRVTSGDVTAVLALDTYGKVTLAWEHAGTRTTKPPEQADEVLVATLKREANELKELVANERDRLEDLLVEERDWPLETWRQRYLDHPVTGTLANRLLWTVVDGGRAVAALPGPGGTFTLAGGESLALAHDARIRVWHPVHAAPEEVRAWRDHILAHELVQPFKQAYREVYLLTQPRRRPASTPTASPRTYCATNRPTP